MKNRLTLMLLLFVCFGAKAQTTYPSGATGCIARWTFDTTESATTLTSLPDMSNNNNPGTTNNIGSVDGFRSIAHHAGSFNGTSSWAQVAHKAMLNPTKMSIVSLVQFSSFNNATCQGNNIVYKGYNYNADLSWAQFVGETDNNCSQVSPATEKLYFVSPNSVYNPPTNNFIQTTQWYMLVTVHDGSKVEYYQILMDTSNYISNILPSDTDVSPMPLGISTDPVFIGVTQNPSYKYWLNANIDEIAIFNKDLSPTEVQSIYNFLWGYVPASTSNMTSQLDVPQVLYSAGTLIIQPGNKEVELLEIYNVHGQCIYREATPENKVLFPSNVSGLYFAHIVTKTGSRTIKLAVFN